MKNTYIENYISLADAHASLLTQSFTEDEIEERLTLYPFYYGEDVANDVRMAINAVVERTEKVNKIIGANGGR